jgi:hypothetical protein
VLGAAYAPDPAGAAYDPAVNATITNSFAHAAFRFGHSQVSERTLLVNNGGHTVGSLSIRDAFFNPDVLGGDPANVARVLKGLASQRGQEVDLLLVDGVRNELFGPPGAGGLDLAALDIQRGRDHGLPDYNNLRARYHLAAVTSFNQISSDPLIQAKLEQLFGDVNNIDAFVGALAEDHLPGSSVGPLVRAIVGNQFERLRDGDRFFYTHDALLQSDAVRQVLDLGDVSLANVIRWNTNVSHLQDSVFFEAPAAGGGAAAVLDVRAEGLHAPGRPGSALQVIVIGPGDARDFIALLLAADGRRDVGVQVPGSPSANPTAGPTRSVPAGAIDANGRTKPDSAPATKRAVPPGGNAGARIAAEADVNLRDPFQEGTTV